MTRLYLVAVCGLLFCVSVGADEPKPTNQTKPQWQRMLTGADAKKATKLEKQLAELEEDNYTELIKLDEELLALRTKVQGADHWETVRVKWGLLTLRKVAALPKEMQVGWWKALHGAVAAMRLHQNAQYGKALAIFQERLKWCQQVLGEEHLETSTSYNNVARELMALGKYSEARLLFQKSLDIDRKVLGEEQLHTAQSYNNLANSLYAQAKYAQAQPLLQKALDIHRKVLGEEHPETAGCYHNVASILMAQANYTDAQPLFEKALSIWRRILGDEHPYTARSYDNVASNLKAQGKIAEAGPLYRKALGIRRKVLGEEHPDTAISYISVAGILDAQGKFAEAGLLDQKALDIRRKVLGEEHPQTAECYNNVAFHLQRESSKYAEAGSLYEKALNIYRKTLGEDHPTTAGCYSNFGGNLLYQGKIEEAMPLVQKALDINRKVLGEAHPSTALSYNNIGRLLSAFGRYEESEALYRKALDINRKIYGENHPHTANAYEGIAMNLKAQGNYKEAATLLKKALDIRLKVLPMEHPEIANSYHNLAGNLHDQGKFAEAEALYLKAVDIRRKAMGEADPEMIRTYRNFAASLDAQGKGDEALSLLEKAAKSYEAARMAAGLRGLDRATFGLANSPYSGLAAARSRVGRRADAWSALEANLARGLLDEIATPGSLDLNRAEQHQSEELRARRTQVEAQLLKLAGKTASSPMETSELDRLIGQRQELDRSLADLAASVSRRRVASLAQLQAALPPDSAFIAWIDVRGVEAHWGCVVRPTGDPHWERLPGSGTKGKWRSEDIELPAQLLEAIAKAAPAPEIEALAKRLQTQRLAPLAKHLVGVKRLFVVPVNMMAGIPIEALTDQYTVSYTPSGTYLARLKDRQRPRSSCVLAVGDPVFPPIKKALQPTALPPGGFLITQVVPNGNAAKARLQAGDVLVSYAGTELKSLEELDKLLAANATAKSVFIQVWREGQEKLADRELTGGRLGVGLAKKPAREAITARRQTDQMLAKLTRGEWFSELPGTQVEISQLSKLFESKNVTTLTRTDASEQRLDAMRKADQLKQFKYLHFATHGKANNFRSFDSALILTPPAKIPEPRAGEPWLDGRLTAAEVLEYWKLDAELVTLSACESALGRQGGGDGLLGFAQAFLLAGSRSVCLTLWQVDDTATALLMDRFYRNLLGKREDGAKPMGKAAALHEAKQWLRNLSASDALERLGTLSNGVVRGERPARQEMKAVPVPKDAAKDYKPYAHPRYWAAFILIGEPE